jgi:hypothetical protein
LTQPFNGAVDTGSMRNTLALLVCALASLTFGCGASTESKAKRACERIDTMCGELIDDCSQALANADPKVSSCVLDAKSCPEVLGCVMGELQRELDPGFDQWEHDFDRGFKKTSRHR